MPSLDATEPGFAFVMVLLIALLVAGVATTLTVVSAMESQISGNYVVGKKTVYLAEAGIQHALWQLSLDPQDTTPLDNEGIGDDKYDAVISNLGLGLYEINARGRTSSAPGTGISARASLFPQAYNYAVSAKEFKDDSHMAAVTGNIDESDILNRMVVDWDALRAEADWIIDRDMNLVDLQFDGVLYVQGKLWLWGDTWINGTLITEDNLEIRPQDGEGAFLKSGPGMPVLVCKNEIRIGDSGEWGEIFIDGFVHSSQKIQVKDPNTFNGFGVFVCKDNFEIQSHCTVTITWDDQLRITRVLGISQSGSDPHGWAMIPGTWTVLDDLTVFEGL